MEKSQIIEHMVGDVEKKKINYRKGTKCLDRAGE